MKISRIVVSALALTAGAAQAQNIEHLTGASAPRNNVVLALNALCSSGFVLYTDSTTTNSPGNVFTAKCNGGNFGATSVNEVRSNVNGGSLTAVTYSFNGPAANTRGFINAAANTCGAAQAGTGVLAPIATVRPSCPTGTADLVFQKSIGGFLDVEGSIFLASGVLPSSTPNVGAATFQPSAFNQAFGVAASKRLYEAMQEYQTAKGWLPSKCTTVVGVTHTALPFTNPDSSSPDCQPSISRADYAAFAVQGNNTAKGNGANWLIGGTGAVNGAGGTSIEAGISISSPLATGDRRLYLCRRPNTSGTQASAQLYFMNNPTGSGAVQGRLVHGGNGNEVSGFADQPQGNSRLTFRTGSGSGDVVRCLNANPGTDVLPATPGANDLPYSIGYLSLENNPVPSSNYRFLKINRQHGTEGTAASSQTAESIAGRYDVWFNVSKYCPNGTNGTTCASILDEIDAKLVAGAASPGIFRLSETNYTRGARSTNPIIAK